MITYAFINGSIILFNEGVSKTISPKNIFYDEVCEAIKENDLNAAWELVKGDEESILEEVVNSRYSEHNVVFNSEAGTLFINGKEQHTYIAERLKDFALKKLPIKFLLNFINRLESNPSFNSRQSLYRFLESRHMPITEDGYIIGYKSVRADFKDWYSGKFDNRVGQIVEVQRKNVDDNINKDCSYGLHVGNYEYANAFHSGNDRQLLLVKVDPADVVAVPQYDCRKLRTCKYEVVSLIKDELKRNVYSDDLVSVDEDYGYDWEDDEYWHE